MWSCDAQSPCAPLNSSSSSSAGGDAGLPLLLQQLPSLQAAGYILHSRWFSNETDYAKQNGGKFTFAVEHDSDAFPGNGESSHLCIFDNAFSRAAGCDGRVVAGFALPMDPEFWLELFEKAKEWGLMT